MEKIIRDYKNGDYVQCEQLVNQAWGFDKIFSSQALSDLVKCIYTKGSIVNSNYGKVVEVDGEVVGFIFGLNEFSKKPGRNIFFGLKMLWRLIRVKGKKPEDKTQLINAIKIHEKNRTKIVGRGKSEIVLFVVAKEFQGKGLGKALWLGFISQCKSSHVASVIVETNKLGASSFYEHIGFKHMADFDSPLHELATKGGQACIYQYECK